MDEFSALANRIAGSVADVRGCLILSRDGLVVGSYPDDENSIKPAWLRFASLGEPDRGFVEFADQVWVYVKRGPYAAFAAAAAGVRPGLLIDQLEQALLSAEDARTRREPLRLPDAAGAPSSKPRTTLHPPTGDAPAPTPVKAPAVAAEAQSRPWGRGKIVGAEPPAPGETPREAAPVAAGKPAGKPAEKAPEPEAKTKIEAATAASAPAVEKNVRTPSEERRREDRPEEERSGERKKPDGRRDAGGDPIPPEGTQLELDTDAEVDRVLLAKEFSGLLQVEEPDDEAKP